MYSYLGRTFGGSNNTATILPRIAVPIWLWFENFTKTPGMRFLKNNHSSAYAFHNCLCRRKQENTKKESCYAVGLCA